MHIQATLQNIRYDQKTTNSKLTLQAHARYYKY